MLPLLMRQAAEAPAAWNVAKTCAGLGLIWVKFLMVMPVVILKCEQLTPLSAVTLTNPSLQCFGAILLAFGSAFAFYSCMTLAVHGAGTPLPFDSPRKLVTCGPYSRVRNPIAISGVLQGFSIFLITGSISIFMSMIGGILFWNFLVRPLEEADLENRFGRTFRNYRSQVRCWILRRTPYHE